jgi:AAA domain/TrwC relaxase
LRHLRFGHGNQNDAQTAAFTLRAAAHGLAQRGYRIERGTGKQGRYFEIAGVPRGLLDAFSARSREVARAAERFRAKWGRAPERGELRALKLENRKAKVLVTRGDLQRAWNETAARFDYTGRLDQTANTHHPAEAPERALEDRVEERLTERAATFEQGELRAVLLEQSVGELAPTDALALSKRMIAERRILPLEGGLMTTLALRAREQTIERRFTRLADPAGRDVGEHARSFSADRVAERIGGRLTDEQAHALRTITGPERAAILVGPAGTGKGVVIDAAARAEQMTGHHTLGIAVSGSTAQRLGQDSPALAGQTLTLDALVARVNRGQLQIGQETTIYFDEAGMGDTDRFDRLTEAVAERGAKLVAIGDAAQLPSIGAGGMFDRLTRITPSAELSNVRRTLDPAEQRAWADLRAGRSDRAMAHYYARGHLHMADTRDEAVEQAVQNWAALTEQHQVSEVALISDASNKDHRSRTPNCPTPTTAPTSTARSHPAAQAAYRGSSAPSTASPSHNRRRSVALRDPARSPSGDELPAAGQCSVNETAAHLAPLLHPVLARDDDVHRDQHIRQHPTQPHRLQGGILDLRLDHQEVQIAVPRQLPTRGGAKQDHA